MGDLIGPSEFSRRSGLSAKALRLYADATILVPATIDPSNGYRSYRPEQLADAATIVLLRGAGVPLADIKRFVEEPSDSLLRSWTRELVSDARQRRECLEEVRARYGWAGGTRAEPITASLQEVADVGELTKVFNFVGQLLAPRFDSTHPRFVDVRDGLRADRPLMLAAEIGDELVGGVLGFRRNATNATLRVIAVEPRYRRRGVGRALVERFEANADALGVETIGLGTDEAVVFWFRLGYTPSLLLQWVFDPLLMEREIARLEDGPIADLEHWRAEFNGVPQLFVRLDEPSLELRAAVRELVAGAHVGFCMFKQLHAV